MESDEAALDFLARELYGLPYDSLLQEHQQEVNNELIYRDSLGWRS